MQALALESCIKENTFTCNVTFTLHALLCMTPQGLALGLAALSTLPEVKLMSPDLCLTDADCKALFWFFS